LQKTLLAVNEEALQAVHSMLTTNVTNGNATAKFSLIDLPVWGFTFDTEINMPEYSLGFTDCPYEDLKSSVELYRVLDVGALDFDIFNQLEPILRLSVSADKKLDNF
jgi:hypothetical protein